MRVRIYGQGAGADGFSLLYSIDGGHSSLPIHPFVCTQAETFLRTHGGVVEARRVFDDGEKVLLRFIKE